MYIDKKGLRKHLFVDRKVQGRSDRPSRDVLGIMPFNHRPDAAMLGYYCRPGTDVLPAFR